MTDALPFVSVVIPAFNVSAFINETLDSVLAQTFAGWEAIVVNDGSADTVELEKVLQRYASRIRYVSQPNRGVGAARNTAIAMAKGEWIAFLDGDDSWDAAYLERQLRELRERQLDMVWCDAIVVGTSSLANKRLTDVAPCSGEVTLQRVLTGLVNIPNSATVVRRSCLQAIGGIDESIRRGQDFDLWVRLLANGTKAGYHNEPLMHYRVREGSLSGDAISVADRELNVLEKLRMKGILAPAELAAVDSRVRELQGAKALTHAKRRLAERDYAAAKGHFADALRLWPQPKLRVIVMLFPLLAPLLRQLYLWRTPADQR